jgi:hypothetical protein
MIEWVVINRSTLRRTRKSRAIHPFRAASFAPTITSYPSVSLSPIFRTLFQVPYPASPLFATLTKTPGVWGYSSHFETVHASSTFKYSDWQMFLRVSELSPFFSDSCALFCTLQKINSFVFKRFRTLSQKPPGVGVPQTFQRSTFKLSDDPLVPLQPNAFGARIPKGTRFLHHPGKQLRSPRCLRIRERTSGTAQSWSPLQVVPESSVLTQRAL